MEKLRFGGCWDQASWTAWTALSLTKLSWHHSGDPDQDLEQVQLYQEPERAQLQPLFFIYSGAGKHYHLIVNLVYGVARG